MKTIKNTMTLSVALLGTLVTLGQIRTGISTGAAVRQSSAVRVNNNVGVQSATRTNVNGPTVRNEARVKGENRASANANVNGLTSANENSVPAEAIVQSSATSEIVANVDGKKRTGEVKENVAKRKSRAERRKEAAIKKARTSTSDGIQTVENTTMENAAASAEAKAEGRIKAEKK